MSNDRYPKLAMFGYVHGQRSRGRPKKRWIDMVRSDCDDMGTSMQEAAKLTQDREEWRRSIEKLPMRAHASPRH
jgi:hypothetical protein